jgi:hypothetical protein
MKMLYEIPEHSIEATNMNGLFSWELNIKKTMYLSYNENRITHPFHFQW